MDFNYFKQLTTADQELLDTIGDYYNKGNFVEAVSLIHERLLKEIQYHHDLTCLFMLKLGGLLIDCGDKARITDFIYVGKEIYNDIWGHTGIVSDENFHYNLGNADHALFKILTEIPYRGIPETIDILNEAKNHYWASFQLYQAKKLNPPIQLLINLGNVLSSYFRFNESIQLIDIAQSINPDFPEANLNRGLHLLYFVFHTGKVTTNLLAQSLFCFEKTLKTSGITLSMKNFCLDSIAYLKQKLDEQNYNYDGYENDVHETNQEYEKHSEYRKFVIWKKIALNEHSIYCGCDGAELDDLAISGISVGGNFIPKMELILNRLKSEFITARWFYYEAITNDFNLKNIIHQDLNLTELYDNESVGANFELLRICFKSCFSILDKIALGICNLFNLTAQNENIYFHSFWNPPQNKQRFITIKAIDNPFLLALYSVASDLNKNGKLSFLKDWRNEIEHKLLILTDDVMIKSHYIRKEAENLFFYVEKSEFIDALDHLLHLTSSTIFYFVYCVRHEGNRFTNDENIPTVKLKPKDFK